MAEIVDLVDERNSVVGETTKENAHKTGERHRAAHVFVLNSKGEIFLQLRAKDKFLLPGLWDSSVGEHVKKGEGFEAAALRGLQEELGITNAKIEFIAEKEIDYKGKTVHNHEFVQLFSCIFDGKIKINRNEIDDGRFFSLEEARTLVKETFFLKTLIELYISKQRKQPSAMEKLPKASIIVPTFNNVAVLERALQSMISLDYPKEKFEIIVASDGSTDETAKMMTEKFGNEKRIKFFDLPHKGVCACRNAAIAAAAKDSEIVVNMDHDCIPERDWLKKIVLGFDSERVGVVSSYNYYGGTSTAFRRDLLERVGGYDKQYGYYREDTDLSFKIMDLGYKFKLVQAGFEHDHKLVKPKGIVAFAKHVLQRLRYHENDVLLYKKHPTKVCKEFLNIKFGFLIDPISDFRVATGIWHAGGKLQASSPRGVVFIESKTLLHSILIIFLGVLYVIAVKLFRFWGSLKFGKFLI